MNTNTINQTGLWERVQAAIDRREDPLEDWQLAQELAACPELAAQVVQLLGSLEHLAPAKPTLAAFLGRWCLPLSGVAAILVCAFVLWRRLPPTRIESPPPANSTASFAFRRGLPSVQFNGLYTNLAGTTRVQRANNLETSEFRPHAKRHWISNRTTDDLQLSTGDTLTYTHSIALPTTR